MTDELKSLIERYRDYQMSEAEQEAQIISFAYGNAHYENPQVTREGIAKHSLRTRGVATDSRATR